MWVAIVRLFWGAFYSLIGSFIARILIALGVGYAQYTGIQFVVDKVVEQMDVNVSGLPAQALAMFNMFGFGIAINIILSAVTVKLALGGVFNGKLTQMIWRDPSGGA